MVDLNAWLAEVRDLHEKACTGELDPGALASYRKARDDLFQAMLVAQQIAREFGHTARQTLRIAWAFQVDLGPPQRCTRAVTLDISAGGFSTLLGEAPSRDRDVEFSLRLPGSTPLKGTARVVAAVPKPGNFRVSFAFAAVRGDDLERLNTMLFGKVLSLLTLSTSDLRTGS